MIKKEKGRKGSCPLCALIYKTTPPSITMTEIGRCHRYHHCHRQRSRGHKGSGLLCALILISMKQLDFHQFYHLRNLTLLYIFQ